jgi:lipase maturation factor 1
MIYDGDCNFCSVWVRRWQQATGDEVDYLPFQDPRVAAQFPELPREQCQAAVQLIEPEGAVFGGAEAVFRTLAHKPHEHWLLDLYYHLPVFAHTTEWGYGVIARHRTFFSALTRLGWGKSLDQPTYFLARRVFLRSLGIIYLIAFVSLWTQITGLVGREGVAPAKATMSITRAQVDSQKIGLDRYHLVPTFCWFSTSEAFLKIQCAAGTVLAVLVIIGIAPAPCLFLLWLVYLSLSTICVEFLSFQWDILLLQTGFLAIFLAPLQLLPRRAVGRNTTGVLECRSIGVLGPSTPGLHHSNTPEAPTEAPPSRLVLWLFRWLLFQLMFESGCIKLVSGDPTWRHLTALNFHYETQPLPTWIAWYAHQLPGRFQKASTIFMFAIELVVPFLIFAPRRLRHFACGALLLLQVLIMLTGNYCFFNLLTIAFCLLLLDDAALRGLLPARLRRPAVPPLAAPLAPMATDQVAALGRGHSRPPAGEAQTGGQECPRSNATEPAPRGQFRRRKPLRWPPQVTVPLACVSVAIGLMHLGSLSRHFLPWPRPFLAAYIWLTPFRTFNSYGLFAVMTTNRHEIIIEGSNNGTEWLPYEFKSKPGDVNSRPRFVEPHQPRLDWQMWFAALGDYRSNPWLVNFCVRLLQGSPSVLGLLERNPFPNTPPHYIRAVVYDYHFTDFATRRKTGAWWRRVKIGDYLPSMSLREKPPHLGDDVASMASPFDKPARQAHL